MAGYTGQLIALNAEPFNLASPLEAANTIRSGQLTNELNSQLAPLKIEQAQQETERYGAQTPLLLESDKLHNQSAALALKGQGRADTQQDQAFQRSLIAQAAGLVDPNDPDAPAQWDAAMQAAADKGAVAAKQFVGRYNPALHQRITQAYGAETPLAAHAAMTGGGMVAPSPLATATGGNAAALDPGMQAQLDQAPIEQVREAAPKLKAVRDALVAISNSADPAATWEAKAHELGLPQFAGHYNPLRIQQLWAETEPVLEHLQSRLDREGSGLPAPAPPMQFKDVGGGLVAINPNAPGGPAVKTLVEPRGKYVPFVGQDGKTYFMDSNTGDVTASPVNLAGKVSNTGKDSVFEQRRSAYLTVHPDDTQGALDYAAGHKAMSPADARKSADAQAARDLSALSLAGNPPKDPAEFLKAQSEAHYAELTAPAAAAAKGAEAGIPARAVAQLKEGTPHTFANGQTWTLKNGKPVRLK